MILSQLSVASEPLHLDILSNTIMFIGIFVLIIMGLFLVIRGFLNHNGPIMVMGLVIPLMGVPFLMLPQMFSGHESVFSDNASTAVPTPVESSAPPSLTPTVTEVPQASAEALRWDWIGYGLVAVIAIALSILVVFLLVKLILFFVKSSVKKRKLAKQQEIERKARHERHRQQWEELLALESDLGKRWLAYEDSLELSLKYPVMRNLDDPKIITVVEAMARAKSYRSPHPEDVDKNASESKYWDAVYAFQHALDGAENYAKRTRWNNFSPNERKDVKQALHLLKMAMDTSNYPEERKRSYERVIRIMERLRLNVKPKTLASIEQSVSGKFELESSGLF